MFERLENLVYFGGRGILLIRHPLLAMLSAYQHLMHGVHSGTEVQLRNNIMDALENQDRDKEIDQEDFERFALHQIKCWGDIILDWLILGKKVLVVYFEDFVRNKIDQMKKVFDFLMISIDQERMNCVKYAAIDFYKRRNSFGKEVKISKKLKKKIFKMIKKVDHILKIFGHSSLPTSYSIM